MEGRAGPFLKGPVSSNFSCLPSVCVQGVQDCWGALFSMSLLRHSHRQEKRKGLTLAFCFGNEDNFQRRDIELSHFFPSMVIVLYIFSGVKALALL